MKANVAIITQDSAVSILFVPHSDTILQEFVKSFTHNSVIIEIEIGHFEYSSKSRLAGSGDR